MPLSEQEINEIALAREKVGALESKRIDAEFVYKTALAKYFEADRAVHVARIECDALRARAGLLPNPQANAIAIMPSKGGDAKCQFCDEDADESREIPGLGAINWCGCFRGEQYIRHAEEHAAHEGAR